MIDLNVSIIYARRSSEDGLSALVTWATDQYSAGISNVLVRDRSGDQNAYRVLAVEGDPLHPCLRW